MYRGFNINYLRESFGIGYETRGLIDQGYFNS